MKKQFIILVLSFACCTASFAQKIFNNQTAESHLARYVKDHNQYLKTETAPDFVMVGSNGWITDLKGILGLSSTTTASTWDYSDLQTHQYGSTGVAIFKMKHSHTYQSGKVDVYNEIWTATYMQKDDKWLLTSWALVSLKPSPKPIKTIVYHKVEDYAKWRAVFDTALGFRKEYGELSAETGTLTDDPKTVYVIQEWQTLDKMQKIFASSKLKEEMGKGGVLSAPTVLMLNEIAK
jgi:hypothetical protein